MKVAFWLAVALVVAFALLVAYLRFCSPVGEFGLL